MSGTGDVIDLEITDVAHGGVFVARHEGRVVFVPDAIPGEKVRVRLTDTAKKSFWRGETLEVLDASPHRRPHVWRQADVDIAPESRPGGADFGHIELGHQRALKLRVLTDALQRFGGIELPVGLEGVSPVLSADGEVREDETPDGTGWRTRVSLHVDAEGRIGPYAARSHRVITVDELPLATAAVERAALDLRGAAPGGVDLVQPSDGRVRVLARPETEKRAPRGRAGGVGRGARRGGKPTASTAGTPATTRNDPARETVLQRVGDRDFRVDAGGFWQVHRLAAHTLTQHVAGALQSLRADGPAPRSGGAWIDPDAWHLDLYGGVGLFAATLGDLGGPSTRVTSVESDARATEYAGENLADWVGARAETGRVDRWLARLVAEASVTERERLSRGVVLLDPPRSGAGREVVESIASLSPETVVYVACDPVALARDIATFRAGGYDVESVSALDLFPNSHHVEAVAILSRSGARR
ncbi:class I SAM-dependent RNA methyltransferase [Microbacterium ureisolvens]|uniref:class I SAM-dependent RNA methyltransferase n=1 Tax=Microbacterium ureisolvens TaxID=2781186 RepID=UPI00363D4601